MPDNTYLMLLYFQYKNKKSIKPVKRNNSDLTSKLKNVNIDINHIKYEDIFRSSF